MVIGARFIFLFAATYLIRLLDHRTQQRLRRVTNRTRVVSGIAGFRGAVSLAAALPSPEVMASGGAFPDRDVIVFVTSGVIVVTLVLQGLLLPGRGALGRATPRHRGRAGTPPRVDKTRDDAGLAAPAATD